VRRLSGNVSVRAVILRRISVPLTLAAEALDLRVLVALVAALCCLSSLALAQPPKLRAVVIRSAEHSQPLGTIIMPTASPLRLVSSVSPNDDLRAAFRGRFTLSGMYKVEGYGQDTLLTMWPDKKSRDSLPHWEDRDVPEELGISNAAAFARAVVPRDKLHKLKTGILPSVRGHVTIIADQYETSIDCDVVSASARFVSVVNKVQIAANPQEKETC
jgi:hypothetical protein